MYCRDGDGGSDRVLRDGDAALWKSSRWSGDAAGRRGLG